MRSTVKFLSGAVTSKLIAVVLALASFAEAEPRVCKDRGSARNRVCGSLPTTAIGGAPFAASAQCLGTLPSRYSFGTLAFTRASSAYCPVSDGTFVSVASNAPRVGRFGLLIEPAATQLLTNVRDLSNAAWTKSNMACTKTATGADGVANSASTCTASAINGSVLQATVLASAQRAASISIKRRTGTGTVEVTMDNGVTWCDATAALATAMANGCRWLRYKQYGNDWHDTAQACVAGCGAMSQTIANPTVGVRLGTNSDAVDVDFAQLEAGLFATSPMNGTSRALDTATALLNAKWPVAQGYIEMKVTPEFVVSGSSSDYSVPFDSRQVTADGPAQYIYLNQNSGALTHGVRDSVGNFSQAATTLSAASNWVGDILFGAPRLWRLEYTSSNLRFSLNGVTKLNTTGTINVLDTKPTNVKLGRLYDGSLTLHGYLSDIKVSNQAPSHDFTSAATVGDSIMRGAFDVYTASAIQAAKTGRAYITPNAVSGDTTSGCTTQYTGGVQGTDTDVVITNCGINNLLGGGESDTVAWGKMQTLLNTMYSDGFRIVAVNLLPCKGYSSCNSTVQGYVTSINTSLAAWVVAHSDKAVLVDVNSSLRDPNDHDALKASCVDESGADNLHPDNSCTIEYANLIAGGF